MSNKSFSFKKNIIIIIIAVLLALGVGGTAVAFGISNTPTNRVSRYMGVAERYLSEMNYEQAVIEFQRILEIEPMNVDAYLGMAEAYIAMGDTDKALEWLNNGYEQTGDARIKAKIDKLTKPVEPETSESEISEPEVSETNEPETPAYGSMGSVTIAGTELDIATTQSLFIYNVESYENVYWYYTDFEQYESSFDTTIQLEDSLSNEDLVELSRLFNLRRLEISVGISDISFLRELPKLTTLILSNNQISDISPLANLTNLIVLWLNGNQINDISSLASLSSLTSLELSHNQISDVTSLSNLTSLTELYLYDNQISNITPLANLTNLPALGLGGNQISDISPLANLTNLTFLNLNRSQIGDITPLANLTNLEFMDLYDNPISEENIQWIRTQLPNCDVQV